MELDWEWERESAVTGTGLGVADLHGRRRGAHRRLRLRAYGSRIDELKAPEDREEQDELTQVVLAVGDGTESSARRW